MHISKKSAFGISALFAIICFVAIYPLSANQMAQYILIFVAISILGFSTVLFRILTKSFTKQNTTILIWIVFISALPHLLFSLLNYGSWICLGGALVIVTALLISRKKFI